MKRQNMFYQISELRAQKGWEPLFSIDHYPVDADCRYRMTFSDPYEFWHQLKYQISPKECFWRRRHLGIGSVQNVRKNIVFDNEFEFLF